MGARVIALPRRVRLLESSAPELRELENEADQLWDQGEVDRAIERWTEIIRHDPSRAGPRRRLARAQMVLGRWEDASRQLNLCLTLLPGSPPIAAELAVCYLHLDQEPNSILLLEDALRSDPHQHLANVAMDRLAAPPPAPARLTVDGLLRYRPDVAAQAEPESFSDRIDDALSAAPIESCEMLFDITIVAPRCGRALYELARLHQAAGRSQWACRYYEQAIRCDRQAWQPYFNLARLYAIDEDFAAARPLLERAVLLCPSQFAPVWLLAQVCEQQQDRAEALFWLDRAKLVDPAHPEVEVALARLAVDEERELAHLEAAVRLGCKKGEVWFNLGLCLWNAGRREAARAAWRGSDRPEAAHALAALALQEGDHQQAAVFLEDCPNAGLLAILAQTCAASEEGGGAIECYRRVVAARADWAAAWLNLGAQLMIAGQPAAGAWQTALQLDPSVALDYFH